jgi:hypothetical protein
MIGVGALIHLAVGLAAKAPNEEIVEKIGDWSER